ncbi:flagellar protein FlaG [Methyloversatilis sp.]|uniref:flagellar protein FlaG n=1 Tax=Methyloversatilis sp. TaxID=2569862 RepID=UPI0035B09878
MAIQPVPNALPQLTSAARTATEAKRVGADTSNHTVALAPLSNEEVERTVDEIRRYIEPVDQNLQFSIDKDTGKTIVKLIDSSTKEVLRQIPSEELIAIARSLGKGQGGLIERKA